ncbi:hypothetical protein Q2E61_15400 [Microbulbifer thermotolerans]|uniref:hypothetical protein n=1 Tax=Microbulbifer thermotolerans TaxID=252514 RepID=UPI002673ACF0|nr:hypothetical protein [Microbulbifer thermotolerans]WKT60277.1 hypothetical protein Q2E61_15400 [Microbulbifer thermotolerans]
MTNQSPGNAIRRKNRASTKIQPDWWSKSFAGAVLGLTLALALAGLFAWVGPGGLYAPDKRQFVMWMIAPLWVTVFSLVYLIPTGKRALLILGGLNLLAFGLLFLVRFISEGRV